MEGGEKKVLPLLWVTFDHRPNQVMRFWPSFHLSQVTSSSQYSRLSLVPSIHKIRVERKSRRG